MRWRGLSGGRSTRCLHCKLTTKERPTDTQALTWRHVTHTMGSSPFLYAPVTARGVATRIKRKSRSF